MKINSHSRIGGAPANQRFSNSLSRNINHK